MRLASPLASAARSFPERTLLEFEGGAHTAAALITESQRLAGGLAAAGVGPGDVVALLGEPSPSWLAHLHAAWWLGAVVAPAAPRAAEAERDALLRRLNPRWIVHERGLALPEGVAQTPWGSFIVAETAAARLTEIDPATGAKRTVADRLPIGLAGGPGMPPPYVPTGVAVGADGSVYFSADKNNAVYRIRPQR